jgi:hypothetical protein
VETITGLLATVGPYLLSGAAISTVTAIIKQQKGTKNIGTLAVVVVASAALNAVMLLRGTPDPDIAAMAAGAMIDAMVAVSGYSVVRAAVDAAKMPDLEPKG